MISCPNCPAKFDVADVAGLTVFKCASCGQVMNLSVQVQARPSPSATAPVGRPAAKPQARPERGRPKMGRPSRKKPDRGRGGPPARRKPVPVAGVISVAGILLVLVVVAGVMLNRGDPEQTLEVATTNTGGTGASKTTEKPKDDDWATLSTAERAVRVAKLVDTVSLDNQGSVSWTIDRLMQLGEQEAAQTVAERYVERSPNQTWVWKRCGYADVRKQVDECLDSCPRADTIRSPALSELTELYEEKAPPEGAWWVSPALEKRVARLLEETRKEERRLADDHIYGVERWILYQRNTHVMSQFPSIHETEGPYLLFAQIEAPVGTDIDAVENAKLLKARTELKDHVDVYRQFYAGWMEHLGPLFGFERFTPENTDHSTLMKVNVFPDRTSWDAYNQRAGYGPMVMTRAYYSHEEPRFITTYVDAEGETTLDERQVQCHEGVHQVQHLYTRVLTSKARGKDVHWDQLDVRPLWSTEGFAEFFSSHRRVRDDVVKWMQPLDSAMFYCWVLPDVVRMRKWRPFSLAKLLEVRGRQDLFVWVTKDMPAQDWELAITVYGQLLYARSWSLVYFLWNAEQGGKPKYRDDYVRYLKHEYVVRFDATTQQPLAVTAQDLRRFLHLESDDAFARFELEWRGWEKALLKKNQKQTWALKRLAVVSALTGSK